MTQIGPNLTQLTLGPMSKVGQSGRVIRQLRLNSGHSNIHSNNLPSTAIRWHFHKLNYLYQLAFMFQTCLSLRYNVQLYELRKQLRKSTKSPGTFSQKYNKTHTHRHNSKSKLGLFLIPEHCY